LTETSESALTACSERLDNGQVQKAVSITRNLTGASLKPQFINEKFVIRSRPGMANCARNDGIFRKNCASWPSWFRYW